ncbi:MAG: ASKHA domain-containing protein [Candidatus Oleimicrobiaceae bacterium]
MSKKSAEKGAIASAEVTYSEGESALRGTFARGTSLLRALVEMGVEIDAVCGGTGTCGQCRVRVSGAVSEPTQEEQALLDPEELRDGQRLACQTLVQGPCQVTAANARALTAPAILTEGQRQQVPLQPNVRELAVDYPAPELERNPSDLEDLLRALGPGGEGLAAPLPVLRRLPSALREAGFSVRVRVVGQHIVEVASAAEARPLLGVAVDIGTTTVVGKLFDLRTGHALAVGARLNAQRAFGEDVISRIQHASLSRRDLRALQERVVAVINEIVEELCAGRAQRSAILEMVCAGNTVMTHLAAGISPQWLAQYPYVPAFRAPLSCQAREIGIAIHELGQVYFLPGIGRFVGGDTVAVILAAGLDTSEEVRLAVDVGTNGEIVLGSRHRLLACSTAAGPAFEGAHITHGMRAAEGAIDRVDLVDGDVRCHVLGETTPQGVCGSGLIDAVAVLLRAGLVDMSGRLLEPAQCPPTVPEALRARLRLVGGERAFLLAGQVAITQRDIREVQLAKGAIAAGARILMRLLGVTPAELDQILLAGAFGNFLRRDNAMRIGLLPAVQKERVSFIGNAACAGAEMALLSHAHRKRGEAIARGVEYVEISAIPDFQDLFAEEMMFPAPESGEAEGLVRSPR